MKPYRLYHQSHACLRKFSHGTRRSTRIRHDYDSIDEAMEGLRTCRRLWPDQQFAVLDYTDKGAGHIIFITYGISGGHQKALAANDKARTGGSIQSVFAQEYQADFR